MKEVSSPSVQDKSESAKTGFQKYKLIAVIVLAVIVAAIGGSFATFQVLKGSAAGNVASHPKGDYQVKMIPLIGRAQNLMLIVGGLSGLSKADQRSGISDIDDKWSEIQRDCRNIKPETSELVAAHEIYNQYLSKTSAFFKAALSYLDTGDRSMIALMKKYQVESDSLQRQYDLKIESIHDPGDN